MVQKTKPRKNLPSPDDMNDKNPLVKVKNKIHLFIGLIITVVLVVLFCEKINYANMLNRLVNVELSWIVYAFLLNIVILFVVSIRWRVILSPVKQASFLNLLSASSIALLGNNFLPARMGELLRIVILSKREKISKSTIAATIFVEKISMSVSLLIMIACMYPLFVPHEAYIAGKNVRNIFVNGLIWFLIGNLIIVMPILLLPKYRPLARAVFVTIFSVLPSKWYEKARSTMLMFLKGFDINKKHKIAYIAFLSFIHWCLFGLRIFFIVRAFHIHIPFIDSFVVIFCVVVAVSMSNVPGHIGTYHLGSVVGLVLINIEINTAMSIAVLLHAVPFIFYTVSGMIFIWRENIQVFDLTATAKSRSIYDEAC